MDWRSFPQPPRVGREPTSGRLDLDPTLSRLLMAAFTAGYNLFIPYFIRDSPE